MLQLFQTCLLQQPIYMIITNSHETRFSPSYYRRISTLSNINQPMPTSSSAVATAAVSSTTSLSSATVQAHNQKPTTNYTSSQFHATMATTSSPSFSTIITPMILVDFPLTASNPNDNNNNNKRKTNKLLPTNHTSATYSIKYENVIYKLTLLATDENGEAKRTIYVTPSVPHQQQLQLHQLRLPALQYVKQQQLNTKLVDDDDGNIRNHTIAQTEKGNAVSGHTKRSNGNRRVVAVNNGTSSSSSSGSRTIQMASNSNDDGGGNFTSTKTFKINNGINNKPSRPVYTNYYLNRIKIPTATTTFSPYNNNSKKKNNGIMLLPINKKASSSINGNDRNEKLKFIENDAKVNNKRPRAAEVPLEQVSDFNNEHIAINRILNEGNRWYNATKGNSMTITAFDGKKENVENVNANRNYPEIELKHIYIGNENNPFANAAIEASAIDMFPTKRPPFPASSNVLEKPAAAAAATVTFFSNQPVSSVDDLVKETSAAGATSNTFNHGTALPFRQANRYGTSSSRWLNGNGVNSNANNENYQSMRKKLLRAFVYHPIYGDRIDGVNRYAQKHDDGGNGVNVNSVAGYGIWNRHIAPDPILQVALSHYGSPSIQNRPHFWGISGYGLYSYGAGNDLHNNLPNSRYKVERDLDN